MNLVKNLDLEDKLKILSDAAKYDVACTSSGVDRKGEKGSLGNSRACGICHSFAADGRCISLLKVLLSNDCIYDCKYCINRRANQRIRTSFTPEELCAITIEFYKRNYIEGLFLSSGVVKNPTYTMELMYRTLFLLTGDRLSGRPHECQHGTSHQRKPSASGAWQKSSGHSPAYGTDPAADPGLSAVHWEICLYGAAFRQSVSDWKHFFLPQ